MLTDLLSNKDPNKRLLPSDAHDAIEATNWDLEQIVETHAAQLSPAESVYFKRLFKQTHRIKQFYISLKIHKKPMSSRPIVSCCGSLPEGCSKWLDYKMKDIIPLVPTHLRDSNQVVQELNDLGELPLHAKLFTADAISMYTNIKTQHGLEVLNLWIKNHASELPLTFPKALFKNILNVVMSENVFQFDDTFWRQEDDTAMGTSCAVQYAGLYYGYHELHDIIPRFKHNLLYFKRFVDDMLGIWIGTDDEEWEAFKTALPFGSLKWETSDLSSSAIFLDLKLEIVDRRIITKTYEKPMNLFLYIPPSSAHSPGVLKSTIFGNVRRYWNQNTNVEDYRSAVQRCSEIGSTWS